MKFKRLKNGILLVLALSLVMRSSCVLALEQSVSRETKSENDLFLYAKNVLEKYILLDEDACKEQKEYGISNGYKIENIDDPNYRIYFVFESNQCVGQIEVSYVKDEFVSSYTHKKESSITNAYVEHMPISLYCIDDDIWVITESECSPMWANGILDLEVESEFSKTEIVVTDICLNRNERNITRAAANKRLAVPIVANATDPDNPNMTICWAASVASISMYKRPSLNMTAVNVISVLKTRYSLPGVGYFDSNWADEAFSLLNVSMNYSASGTNYNAVKGYITQNKPIYAGINDGDAYHAVVICGYIELATGEKYYSLMDPNKNSYVTTSSINANTTDFTYVTSGHVYTDWHRRFW